MRKKIIRILLTICCFGNKIKIAKKLGVSIGERCRILGNVFHIFGSEPYLVKIGNHVSISNGTIFITHHGEYWVFRDNSNEFNCYEKIVVGNNVFIGQNCIILPGVTIGDNVVIGAFSIVNKDVPSNSVFAGNPAKYINSIDNLKANMLSKKIFTKKMTDIQKKKELIK